MDSLPRTLRKRNPFKFTGEEESEEPLILDEQEQEELVNELRFETSTIHGRYLLGLRIIVSLSCVLHIMSLSNPAEPPTTAMLPTRSPTDASPPIPFPFLFTWVNISVHLFVVFKSLVFPGSRQTLALRRGDQFCGVAAGTAPALCVMLTRPWAHILWWSFAGLVLGLDYLVRMWIYEDDESLDELEKLKYHARGA